MSWSGPRTLPSPVLRILWEGEVEARHSVCNFPDKVPARWVQYYNGKVNCEVKNKPCMHCMGAGPWLVNMEDAKTHYQTKWGRIGKA